MNRLPVVQMTLYKHGVGFFTRRGKVTGEALSLTFRREEMDDLLKSLTVIDHGGGQIHGVDYDTPQSRAERLAGNSVILDEQRSLRDLLLALRGRQVRLFVADGSDIAGTLVGLDEPEEKPLKQSLVSVLENGAEKVTALPLNRLEGVELLDNTAAADLRFFLQTSLVQESHRSITIRLSPNEHDLEVSYIAPAPTWRVSYRLVLEQDDAGQWQALLQGWGIFDNRLEEDLTGISLSLTAGMPISFVYNLVTPHTPERPVVKDEDRVAAAPVMFEAAMAGSHLAAAPPSPAPEAGAPKRRLRYNTMEEVSSSVRAAAEGAALGELFQYNVSTPVTVGRGQSAMVPIVSSTLKPKKDLIYNGRKIAKHPVATLRFNNSTGLTLERGPVTVLDSGEYVGEAVLPFTADQAEVVVSYAVELGVHIHEKVSTGSQLHSLELSGAYLVQHLYDSQITRYVAENRTAQSKTILIEHNRRNNYDLFDTPEPAEKTADTYRFRIEVPAGKSVEFTVQERWLRASREELRRLSHRNLQTYFEKRLLDHNAYRDLKGLLDLLGQIELLRHAITEQEKRVSAINAVQQRVRENLVSLKSDGDEGKLRGKFVQQLAASEAELDGIAKKVEQLNRQIQQKEAQVEQVIAGLGQNQ
ncbi:MAG: hypothetical protein Kow0031_12150 [Anaerolineae bacterium]